MKEQKRYIAIIIYESSSPSPNYQPLYEECWTMIEAQSDEQAQQKAEKLAQANEHSYENCYGEMISWSFKQLVRVTQLLYDSIEDGTELQARYFRNYQAYCEFESSLSGEEL